MINFNDDILRELIELYATLSEDDQFELLDHARWLAVERCLRGGPFDGLLIPEKHKNALSIAIELGERIAVYDRDEDFQFRFDSIRRKGGEGGTWPDIYAKELQALQGGSQ